MADFKSLKKVHSTDKQLHQVQDLIEEFLQPLLNNPTLNGTLVINQSLIAGQDNLVEHKLNRKITGFYITRKRGPADVWDLQDTNKLPTSTLLLRCSADVSIDLWVY